MAARIAAATMPNTSIGSGAPIVVRIPGIVPGRIPSCGTPQIGRAVGDVPGRDHMPPLRPRGGGLLSRLMFHPGEICSFLRSGVGGVPLGLCVGRKPVVLPAPGVTFGFVEPR